MSFQSVVLSVPHAVCVQGRRTVQYPCDSASAPFASLLHRGMSSARIASQLLLPSISRITCDLNRKVCRDTEYRGRLRAAITPTTLLIDVHSFPADSQHGNLHGYVLDDDSPPAWYSSSLVSYIKEYSSYNFSLFRGRGNDIMDEARDLGVSAFLLEINENLSSTDYTALANLIVNWLSTVVVSEQSIDF